MAQIPRAGTNPAGLTWSVIEGYPSPLRLRFDDGVDVPTDWTAVADDLGLTINGVIEGQDLVFTLDTTQTMTAAGRQYLIVDASENPKIGGHFQRWHGEGHPGLVRVRLEDGTPVRAFLGSEGVPGPKGDIGPTGPPFVVLGEVADYASLPASPNDGDAYLTLDTDQVFQWNGTDWILVPFGSGGSGIAGATGAAEYDAGTQILTVPIDADPATGSARTLGTGANQAAPGNDARFTDERVPVDASVTAAKLDPTLDADLKDRGNHTGTQDLDTTTDSAARLAMTPAERTKLTGLTNAGEIVEGANITLTDVPGAGTEIAVATNPAFETVSIEDGSTLTSLDADGVTYYPSGSGVSARLGALFGLPALSLSGSVMASPAAGRIAITNPVAPSGAGDIITRSFNSRQVLGTLATVANATSGTVATHVISSGDIKVGDVIRLKAWGHLLSNTGSTQQFTFRIGAGGLTFGSGMGSINTGATPRRWDYEADIIVTAATEATYSTLARITSAPTGTTGSYSNNSGTTDTRTTDPTWTTLTAVNVAVLIDVASADASITCIGAYMRIER